VRPLLGAWRLFCAVLHGLHGVVLVLGFFPRWAQPRREACIAWWSAKMLRVLGLRLQVQGQFKPGAKLIVANHVSWLDIMAVHAVCPQARFVSKADVQAWPVVRHLVDSARTLYIQRETRRDALRVMHEMAEALQAGDTVAVFPEGTTGLGPELLPFHANLLQAAIATATLVQPVLLRYADRHGPYSASARFVGDISLKRSLWLLACGEGLQATVQVLPAQGTAHADRRRLAEHLREELQARLPVADAASEASGKAPATAPSTAPASAPGPQQPTQRDEAGA
jgi:1-acyl-sn-glycerol-3-phosphate acyltransferase